MKYLPQNWKAILSKYFIPFFAICGAVFSLVSIVLNFAVLYVDVQLQKRPTMLAEGLVTASTDDFLSVSLTLTERRGKRPYNKLSYENFRYRFNVGEKIYENPSKFFGPNRLSQSEILEGKMKSLTIRYLIQNPAINRIEADLQIRETGAVAKNIFFSLLLAALCLSVLVPSKYLLKNIF